MDRQAATRIAEEFVAKQNFDSSGAQYALQDVLERDFGWVCFWGPKDPSVPVAGNAPFIVDRRDGSLHVTGTAFPVDRYIESYARIGRAYPFAVPKHVVVLEGWRPGMLKVSLTKLIRASTDKGLAEAKRCTDDVLERKPVALTFPTADGADAFCAQAEKLGALARRETRYQ